MKKPTAIPSLSCPTCYGALAFSDTAYRCQECSEVLPINPQGVTVAVTGAIEFLQSTARQIGIEQGKLEASCAVLEAAMKKDPWRTSPQRLLKAMRSRIEFGESELNDLKKTLTSVGIDATADKNAPTTWGFGFSDFMFYDWSKAVYASEQREKLLGSVKELVKIAAPSCRSPLLVGGGAGRHFFDLAKELPNLVGCDFDYTYVDTYHRLRHGAVELHDLHAPLISDNEMVTSEVCVMPSERPQTSERYFVGDATKLPFAEGAMDCVISIYMTDCVPLPTLLKELRRVLAKDGAFVSAGPLFYRGVDPEHWYSPSEVMKLCADFGFRCEQESWIDLPYWNSPHKGSRRHHRVWTYVLRKL